MRARFESIGIEVWGCLRSEATEFKVECVGFMGLRVWEELGGLGSSVLLKAMAMFEISRNGCSSALAAYLNGTLSTPV